MIKQTIKYTDFNGVENEEVFYFNLTKAELTKLELGKKNGMSNHIKEVVESGDNAELLEILTSLILDSYGAKSEDGKRFIKTKTLREEFEQSPAFSEIFMKMLTTPESAEAFINGITA